MEKTQNIETKEIESTEVEVELNEQSLLEELQTIEAAELSIGHAFHAFRFNQ